MADSGQIISLKDYLYENKDLLSILGVFIAIAVLAGNLSIKLIAALISLFSFTCATLILIEFWKRPLSGKPSFNLRLFKVAFSLLLLGFLVYLFVVFDGIYPDAIFPVLVITMAEIEGWCIKKLKQKEGRIKNSFEYIGKRKVLVLFVGIVITLVTIAAARKLANAIDVPLFKIVVSIVDYSNKITGPIQ